MNKIFFSIILFVTMPLLSCISSQKNMDCSRFKTGKYISSFDQKGVLYIIERMDSIQKETNTVTGHVVKAKIRWVSTCEYELFYQDQTMGTADTIISYVQSKPLKTKIIKAGKDYYVYQSTMEGVDMVLIDSLRVFND